MTPKNEVTLVADDNGYAAHKIAWYERGVIKTAKINTAIETGHTNTTATGVKLNAYTVGDGKYTCTSDSNQLINLRHDKYPLSVENRVLFTHAIVGAGLGDKLISAAVTLPFRDYYGEDGNINAEFAKDVALNFKQNDVVIGDNGGKSLNVTNVQVLPEAVAAWFDWAMNDDGSMNDDYYEMSEANGSMLVIDIGGSTTDIVSVTLDKDENLIIRTDKSTSAKRGVLDAMGALHTAIGDHLEKIGQGGSGHGFSLSQKLQMQALENGKIRLNGARHDFTEQRNVACANTANAIANFINETVGSTLEYFSILFVGGGSVVFKPWMEKMIPNAEFSDEFANARGTLKYLKGKQEG